MTKASQIPYGRQWIDKNDIAEVVKTLRSDWITTGPKISQFENAIASYVDAKYAACVTNGTSALHLACLVAGIGPGDEVIVPTMSFVASTNCVLYCNAKPILVDIYEDTLTINVEEAEKKITKKTKAIIAVDFAGHPANWSKLKKLAKTHKLILIDDAAHAFGSKYQGHKIGSIANLTTFSFHPVKTITTAEGGAVTTNNKSFYEKLLLFRNHGIEKTSELSKKFGGWYYEVKSLGYNFRMTDLQAALGLSQLSKIDAFIKKRRSLWKNYQRHLNRLEGIVIPKEEKGVLAAWHLYPIRIKEWVIEKSRREVFEALVEAGIQCQVHYIPIHLQPLYRKLFGYKLGDFPIAEKYYSQAISLPLFSSLTNQDQTKVIKTLKKIVHEG